MVVGRGKDVLLLGPDGVHAVGEFLGLLEVGQFAFHPDHVCVGGEGNGSVDGAAAAALVSVVAFSRPWGIPVPVDVDACEALCDGSGLRVALAFHRRQVLFDEAFFVDVDSSVDGVHDGFIEEFETRLSGPLVVDGLKSIAVLPGLLGGYHEIVEGLEGRVRGSEDEGVVSVVDRRHDQCGGFGIRPGNSE